MSIERAFKPWFQKPTARTRQIRPIRDFHLQPLEGRIALSGAMPGTIADVPASPAGDQSAFVQVSSAHDATAQPRERVTVLRLTADDSGAASPFALPQPTGAPIGTAPDSTVLTSVSAGNAGSQPSTTPDQTKSSSQTTQPESGPATDPVPPGPTEPDLLPTPSPAVKIAQTNVAEDVFDPGLLGPLAWADSEEQVSGLVDGGGEVEGPAIYAAGKSTSVLSAQQDVAEELGIGSYSDFPGALALRAFSFAGPHVLDPHHGMQTVDAQNNSILAGTLPWRSLLSGLDFPDRTASDEHQRFAELSPLEQSWPLALVATLWTTHSWAPFSPGAGGQSTDRSERHLETTTPLSSWKAYVMRLDSACERSYSDICEGLKSRASAHASRESSSRELAGSALWRMPMVPMAGTEWPGASQGVSRTDGRSPSDQEIAAPDADFAEPRAAAGELGPTPLSQRDSERGAEPGSAIPAAVPIVTVITGSTVVAGWFFTRGASWPRRRGEQTGSRKGQVARGIATRAPTIVRASH
jgi:hypothetical protein